MTKRAKCSSTQADMTHPDYNANGLLDVVMTRCRVKNDSALAMALGCAPSLISKIRHHTLPVGASVIIRMHDATGMTISQIRAFLGMKNGERAS